MIICYNWVVFSELTFIKYVGSMLVEIKQKGFTMSHIVSMKDYRGAPVPIDTNAKIGLKLWLEWFEIDAITDGGVKLARIMDYRERMYRLKDIALREIEQVRSEYESCQVQK